MNERNIMWNDDLKLRLIKVMTADQFRHVCMFCVLFIQMVQPCLLDAAPTAATASGNLGIMPTEYVWRFDVAEVTQQACLLACLHLCY
jgi:hypothetical protein